MQRHEWVVYLGRVAGRAGDKTQLSTLPQVYFEPHSLQVGDTVGGGGTQILGFRVNGKSQLPDPPIPSFVFGKKIEGAEVKYDPCPAGAELEVEIEFLTDCTCDVSCAGIAEL